MSDMSEAVPQSDSIVWPKINSASSEHGMTASLAMSYFYGKNAVKPESGKQLLAHVPLGRPGTVLEVANCVLFLASPESTYMNGHTLCVDGGWSADGYLRDF